MRTDRAGDRRLRENIRLLLDTARVLSREPDLNTLFAHLHDLIAERFPAWSFFIALAGGEGQMSVPYHVEDGRRADDIHRVPVDASITGQVFCSGQPVLLRTPQEFARVPMVVISPSEPHNAPASGIFAPLCAGDRTIGVISVQSDRPNSYDEEDLELLVAIAEQTAIAVENSGHLHEIESQRRELELLVEIAGGLASDEFSMQHMCRRVHHQLQSVIDARVFYVALLSDDGLSLLPEYCAEAEHEVPVEAIPLAKTLAEQVLQSRNAIMIGDLKRDKRVHHYGRIGINHELPQSILMVPLCIGDTAIGIVSVQSLKKHAFTQSSLRILHLVTNQLALAIKNVQLFRETEQRVDRDALTGLFNRSYTMRRLAEELERAARRGNYVCALMLDLDRFKDVNDTYGHPIGDLAIRTVADGLRQACRSSDIICRYGGDEFLIVCPDLAEPESRAIVTRIRDELRLRRVAIPGSRIELRASIGVAISTPGMDAAAIVDAADRDLYQDKAHVRAS